MKFKKIFFFSLIWIIGKFNPALSTKISYKFYRSSGMIFRGLPNYISSSVFFDGGNYSLIELGEGVTISSNVSFLTHDWALNTVIRAMKISRQDLLGRHKPIVVGNHSFIGRGCIILPGANIGEGVIIGAGSVVRGSIPDYSIVIGNPAQIIGDSKTYVKKFI